jgi:hypothetical protein
MCADTSFLNKANKVTRLYDVTSRDRVSWKAEMVDHLLRNVTS